MLDDEMYHYRSKVVLKEAQDGGAWERHQDYGYWYHNGCLYPDMVSVSIAIDPTTRENGCMQLFQGSQKMCRIEHGEYDGQFSADPGRTEHAIQRLELVHVEMRPGDALFFSIFFMIFVSVGRRAMEVGSARQRPKTTAAGGFGAPQSQ